MKIFFSIKIISLLLFINIVNGQTLDSVLKSVAENNKTIKANQNFWESKKAEYGTGLYPENPFIEYGHFPGNTSAIGTKKTFGISQSFDFPIAYFNKISLANRQIEQADLQIQTFIQETLLQGKIYYYELIYLNKLNKELKTRVSNAQNLSDAFRIKLDRGDASILDCNKARLQLLSLKSQFRMNEAQILGFNEKLKQMNGNIEIEVTDSAYNNLVLKELEIVIDEAKAKDPLFKVYEYDRRIAEGEVSVNKSLWWPKIEVGYEEEKVMDENYKGLKFGISVPLWENWNTVEQAQYNVKFSSYRTEQFNLEFTSQIKQQYQKVLALKNSLAEYSETLDNLNSLELLQKSLDLGQISAIEYFMELTYFYDIYDDYLELERDYYKGLAELYKYEL